LHPPFDLETQVFPGYKSFILIQGKNQNELTAMESVYSLSPAWASKKVKFATYNTRIETIFTKPTWKNPIRFKRCLVPIDAFYESIYEKEFAGNVVKFSQKDDSPILAAGIWDSWIDPTTKKSSTGFAIITREPYDFINKAGHDRSPIIMQKEYFEKWLNPDINGDENKILNILTSQKDDLEFKAEIVRELKGHNKNQLKMF
jgi:putative SOS response-associated peptidase YedK